MNETIKKLVDIEKAVATDRGPFDLFALFSSDGEQEDRWDLVISATWIGYDSLSAIEYMIKQLRARLTTDEFSMISKIAPLDIFDLRVIEMQNALTTEHRSRELPPNYRFNGSTVERVYVITCKPQFDKSLLQMVWNIIVRKWKSGDAGMIESQIILAELLSNDVKVGDYALDRVFEYLMKAGCIAGAGVGGEADAIRQHGSLSISEVKPNCHLPAPVRMAGPSRDW